MEVQQFELSEVVRDDLEELLFQLSGKKRELDLSAQSNAYTVGVFDIAMTKEKKCSVINLTTRTERAEAISLFDSLGFAKPGNEARRLDLTNTV